MDDSAGASPSSLSRADRKAEGKKLKREKIASGGGKRPRSTGSTSDGGKGGDTKNKTKKKKSGSGFIKTTLFVRGSGGQKQTVVVGGDEGDPHHNKNNNNNTKNQGHRFGRVMEKAPCLGRPVYSTLSIAVPGSVMSNCQTRELRTVMVGQIARAAALYHVDEIVVFDDHLANRRQNQQYYHRRHRDRGTEDNDESTTNSSKSTDPHTFMARLLQFCECPQYLRRAFFPMHPDLQFTAVLPPLDSPHHVRAGELSRWREGVVLEPDNKKDDDQQESSSSSLVNCGLYQTPVEIDRKLTPGLRCTVQLLPPPSSATDEGRRRRRRPQGTVVSPSAPREYDGTYWGYTTRLASSLKAVLDECPYEKHYDLTIGTSERGHVTVDDEDDDKPGATASTTTKQQRFKLPPFRHAMVVFGGVAGIEECVDADETLKVSGKDSHTLFDMWINTCPYQGSRTIRTEEAVLITLARLRPHVLNNENNHPKNNKDNDKDNEEKHDITNDKEEEHGTNNKEEHDINNNKEEHDINNNKDDNENNDESANKHKNQNISFTNDSVSSEESADESD